MSELMVVLGAGDAPAYWGRFEDGRLAAQGEGLDALPLEGERVRVIVPGVDVLVKPVDLPPKAESRLASILPFLLEEELAVPMEDLHFAIAPARADRPRLAAVVSKERMADWLGALRMAGFAPQSLTPDFMAIGDGVVSTGAHVLAAGPEGGFAAEPEIAQHLLDAPVPAPLSREALLQHFRQHLSAGETLNLLQGAFAPRRPLAADLGRWRRTGVLAALAVACWFLYLGSSGWWHDREAERLDAQSAGLLRETFPDISRVVNAEAQMRGRLNELRGASADRFLRLSTLLFESMRPVENMSLRSLRFDEARAELSAEVAYGGFDDMQAVKDAIARQGGELSEGTSRQSGNGMMGDVTVRLP